MKISGCVILTSALAIGAANTVNAPNIGRPPDALNTTVERNFQIGLDRGAGSDPDFFGNAVHQAVSQYRLDDSGDLYEVHSPEIELTRLPGPKG